jgi:hypothetical protein
MRWKAFGQRQGPDERPNCVADALRHATDLGTYPALAVLLHIFATLPVTTASGERSLSALKYLKKLLAVNNG